MATYSRLLSQINQAVLFPDANNIGQGLVLLANNIIFSDATTLNTSAGLSGSDQIARDTANAAFEAANTASAITIGEEQTSSALYFPIITTTLSGPLTTANTNSAGLYFVPDSGTFSANVFVSLSDKKYKNNIFCIEYATNTVIQLQGVSFNWNHNNTRAYGVIAQDVENVIPEIVQTNVMGVKTVNYDSFIPFLIESIKEQHDEIQKLKVEIESINSRLGK